MLTSVARLTTRHRRLVLSAWTMFFVIGMSVGGSVFGALRDPGGDSHAESVVGFRKLDRTSSQGASTLVLVDDDRIDDPATVAGVRRAEKRLSALDWVKSVASAYSSQDLHLR